MKYLWMFLTIASAFILGKRVVFWALMSYLFSWAALIAVLALPANRKKMDARSKSIEEWSNRTIEQAAVEKEMKSVNTVDDLFKQLENK